jgi:hypothetical protein
MLCGGFILGTWFLDHRIRINREERERHFVTVHFIAMDAAGATDDEAPKTIEELMERHAGGPDSVLLKPFRHGLIYEAVDGGFKLTEPRRRFVTLFRRDRMITSDHEWPHWETSGCKVWKFSGQEIPPNYMRTKRKSGPLD